MKKKFQTNLSKLNTKTMQTFSNDKMLQKDTKNFRIVTDKTLIDKFMIVKSAFYIRVRKLSLKSRRHFLVVILLNMEKHFKAKYGTIQEPDDDYLTFYTNRGRKNLNRAVIGSINFLLTKQYASLYFKLMHTYYINEKSHLQSYSISQFFEYVVSFSENEKLELEEVYF